MKTFSIAFGLLAAVGGLWTMLSMAAVQSDSPPTQARELARKLQSDGNFKDAFEAFAKLARDPNDDPAEVSNDLTAALQCLQQLGRVSELEGFCEEVVAAHSQNWRLLKTAADQYRQWPEYGYMIAGKFERGSHRGGGEEKWAGERDRVRALQLYVQAMPLLANEADASAAFDFYAGMGDAVLYTAAGLEAWRLQALTDLTALPDYEDWWHWDNGEAASGAAVDADGNPVYHTVPESFEAATSDGQRWRWALAQAAAVDPARKDEATWRLAQFWQSQFGEQTLQEIIPLRGFSPSKLDESGTYALHTLGEDETIAKLATGVRRFKLPDEFNYIKLYQQLADAPQSSRRGSALDELAQVFEDRRQYTKAADYWRRAIEVANAPPDDYRRNRLAQIEGNWGRFEFGEMQPAGRGATFEFRYRNGRQVEFTAREIDIAKLLDDVKAYLKTAPRDLDWQKLDVSNLGYRLVERNEQQYLGRETARWTLDLEPRENHFDRRITVTTPLETAGAYFVTAKMADGNTCHTIVWLADTVIVKKPLADKMLVYVADAVSGRPIAKANVELFGYRQQYFGRNQVRTETKQFAEATDADGQAVIELGDDRTNYTWLVIARAGEKRLAHLGYTSFWSSPYYDQQYNETKVYSITDRPVYRPDQKVSFKFWLGQTKYDVDSERSPFAGQTFLVELHNPKGDSIHHEQLVADEYGGLAGDYKLPADAMLGVYRLSVHGLSNPLGVIVDKIVGRPTTQGELGGGTFRVEEYKKPEFEVTVDAPSDPVMLGEKIEAKIRANYYFGSPVTEARVKYKVTRTGTTEPWYPPAPWDWFYGRGYWWFSYDYAWLPGWSRWGCVRPVPIWWNHQAAPPELVAEAEVPIGADGEVVVTIDTTLAKELHGDQDHEYNITAEVVDQSRRTIVGAGKVLVAREPFKVFAWVDRGHYRVGDTVTASFAARTLNDKPVVGNGTLKLLKIGYEGAERKPVETVAGEWQLATDAEGQAEQKIVASAGGQYRLSYTLIDAADHAIEGGYVFTIMGDDTDAAQFRYASLELVADKREYEPGEKVQLQINTDRAGGTVLLFVRPANGVYLPPQVVRLSGKSTMVEVEVETKDMPNFFVEAMTLADARLYTEVREIAVPPAKRVLNLAVEPSADEYKPGEEAEVKLTLTDFFGKPFVGSTVVAIYDKSVEYISGGSNVPEIKEFFWKWRRHHYPATESSLAWAVGNLVKSGVKAMRDLGIFGGTVADEVGRAEYSLFSEQPASGARMDLSGAVRSRSGPIRFGMPLAEAAAAPMAAREGKAEGGAGAADFDALIDVISTQVEPLVEPTVRSNFADTALWIGALETDGDGVAVAKLTLPESLTTWKIRTWGMGAGTRVGEGTAEVVTTKNLLVRLQAPRFFVETDEVVLSANVHNKLDVAKQVTVALELDGGVLEGLDELTRQVTVEAGGEARVDWRVRVTGEGEAIVRAKALSDVESDAVEMKFPAYVHGMLKMESLAGAIRPDATLGRFEINVPYKRREADTRLEVRYSPTLAGAMVDALPYLVEYPYGCTEQTLSRFLPTVITQRILLDMQLDLAAIRDKQTNLNAQELGDAADRAAGWKRYKRNPVFDEAEVARMVKQGVEALTEMQLSDGGWGWFSGYGEHSYPHTTAYVVHGLQIAQQNDVALVPGVLDRGIAWLETYQSRQVELLRNADGEKKPYKTAADNLDAFVFMVLVDAGKTDDAMRDFLYRDRVKLAVYAKAMYGLALEKLRDKPKLDMILSNIEQFVVQDEENQTAYLELPQDNYWWYWYGSSVEANAYYLKLLARTDPRGQTASRLVKYLLNNRKHASYWNSTRDTAVAIEALAEYLKASGEDRPDMTVEVWLDGKKHKEVAINRDNLFTFDSAFVLEGAAVASGAHTVELRKRGSGPLYYNAYVTNFTLEDHITSAGLEVKVNRRFYKLVRKEAQALVSGSRGQAIEQAVEKYERVEIPNLGELTSGDLVEVELEIDSKNDYEYLIFEDMKAAGFEPVDLRSGYTGNALGAYVEYRDNRASFFVRALARGKHSVAYRLRAEIPGRFSALPATAEAMYAPELKGNSDEIKVEIIDRQE